MIICNIEDKSFNESLCKSCGIYDPDDDGLCLHARAISEYPDKYDALLDAIYGRKQDE
jgi:hypothetical protein